MVNKLATRSSLKFEVFIYKLLLSKEKVLMFYTFQIWAFSYFLYRSLLLKEISKV